MINWINYAPPPEIQHSNTADFADCVSESGVHCIESQEIKKYGHTNNYSERALAKLSGTTPSGNDAETVFNTIKQYGLILDSDWLTEPTPNMTWEEFYAPIPPEILAKAIKVDVELSPGVNFDLAPAWTALLIGGTEGHMVEGLNPTQYFDSYEQFIKTYDSSDQITWQGSLVLKGTPNMAQFKTQNYKGELRIVLQADTPATWQALCQVYGIDPAAAPDETV